MRVLIVYAVLLVLLIAMGAGFAMCDAEKEFEHCVGACIDARGDHEMCHRGCERPWWY